MTVVTVVTVLTVLVDKTPIISDTPLLSKRKDCRFVERFADGLCTLLEYHLLVIYLNCRWHLLPIPPANHIRTTKQNDQDIDLDLPDQS